MVADSSILAWRNPWTEEPGWLYPMGHKESDLTEQLTHIFHEEMGLDDMILSF